jgi:hypothetical protein
MPEGMIGKFEDKYGILTDSLSLGIKDMVIPANPFVQLALKNLCEYEQAEKEGILIKLPCKVGDKVFIVFSDAKDSYFIEDWNIRAFMITQFGLSFQINDEDGDFHEIDLFGKTVFLTKEEAEKALQEKTACTSDKVTDGSMEK